MVCRTNRQYSYGTNNIIITHADCFLPSLEFSLDVCQTHCSFICFLCSAELEIFKADDHSFLFTLINPSGTQPIKLSAKPSGDLKKGGVLCEISLGPCFGNERFFDLKLRDAVEGNDFLLEGDDHAFICPSNFSQGFTPGTDFIISELEVFKVNFES